MLRIRLYSHPAAERRSAGSTRWPILVLVRAVALMAGALISSAASAQCLDTMNALTSAISTVNTAFLPNGSAFVSAPNSAPDQQGGGVWTRAIAGSLDTNVNSEFNTVLAVTPSIGPSFPLPLNLSCHSKTDQDFKGAEVGHDIALLNTGNSGMYWHFGVLAGYVESDLKLPSPETSVGPQPAGVIAPYAGLYAAFSKGNLFADAQARLNNFEGESLGQRLDAHGYSFTGNAGYRFDLGG